MRPLDAALIAAAFGTVAVLALAPTPARPETVAGATIRVIDGDTVALPAIGRAKPEHIRLIDIDAPEISHPRCAAEIEPANRATARLQALIEAGPVTVERHGRDRYRRTLARLWTGKGEAGAILVAEGLALPYAPGPDAWRARAAHWCGGRR
jgi:endonuclease YncB( thermonuclease family)